VVSSRLNTTPLPKGVRELIINMGERFFAPTISEFPSLGGVPSSAGWFFLINTTPSPLEWERDGVRVNSAFQGRHIGQPLHFLNSPPLEGCRHRRGGFFFFPIKNISIFLNIRHYTSTPSLYLYIIKNISHTSKGVKIEKHRFS